MDKIDELMELIKKKDEAMQLIDEIKNPIILQYYDFESDKDMDKKIEVLRQVKGGKSIDKIKGFWDILELYQDEAVI